MIDSSYKDAKISWDAEVDVESARLIKSGLPPWQAVAQAVKNINQRRREKVSDGE